MSTVLVGVGCVLALDELFVFFPVSTFFVGDPGFDFPGFSPAKTRRTASLIKSIDIVEILLFQPLNLLSIDFMIDDCCQCLQKFIGFVRFLPTDNLTRSSIQFGINKGKR